MSNLVRCSTYPRENVVHKRLGTFTILEFENNGMLTTPYKWHNYVYLPADYFKRKEYKQHNDSLLRNLICTNIKIMTSIVQ